MTKHSKEVAFKRVGVAVLGSAFLFLHASSSYADDSSATAGSAKPAASAAASTAASAAAGSSPSTNTQTGSSAATPATGTTGAAASTSGAASGQPLQAGAQVIELNLETLRELGLDLKNVMKAAISLYDEVTIQPVNIMTEPEVIGFGTVINIPVGFTPTGAGPQPKKERVDMAMSQMRPIIELLKKDMDEFEEGRRRLDISDSERKDLQPDFDKWKDLVTDTSNYLVKLESLTKAKPYDCAAIGSASNAIHEDTKKMDEVRRKVYKFIQKEGKKKKNA